MKKILTALAAVAAVTATAVPAAAQSYDHSRHDRYDRQDHRGGWSINERQQRLDRRIDQGLRNGSLTQREARRLREEFRDIARLEARYRANGLSPRERAHLDDRFDRLEARIRHDRNDRQYGSRR